MVKAKGCLDWSLRGCRERGENSVVTPQAQENGDALRGVACYKEPGKGLGEKGFRKD